MNLPDSYPLFYRMATFIYVPCGKCEACLNKRKTDWFVRLKKEHEMCDSAYFITLTYDEDKVPRDFVNVGGFITSIESVSKKDCQNFLKRLRYDIRPFKVRYFLISEYGPQTLRPHYHMILFDFPNALKDKIGEYIEKSWGNGFVSISPVTDARISYVVSYCLDNSKIPEYLPKNFMLCSRKPGIGSVLFDDFRLCDYITYNDKHPVPVQSDGETKMFPCPRYYRDKLFDQSVKDKTTLQGIEYNSKRIKQLKEDQRCWLMSKGIPVTPSSLMNPYDGSPMSVEHQKKEMFKSRVNSKNKKNKKKI